MCGKAKRFGIPVRGGRAFAVVAMAFAAWAVAPGAHAVATDTNGNRLSGIIGGPALLGAQDAQNRGLDGAAGWPAQSAENVSGTRLDGGALLLLPPVDGDVPPEGEPEGEGEGAFEGAPEGLPEGELEGEPDGGPEDEPEGDPEGDTDGEPEGEALLCSHSADQDGDCAISLSELLRVIQFFNTGGLHCAASPDDTEDGYVPGADADAEFCTPHDSDYDPQDWVITLSNLLRLIQFFNTGAYHACPGATPPSEDGFCPGPSPGA